jgi:hypothetical protein
MYNSSKTVSANAKGIHISFGDKFKHKFVAYESQYVKQVQLTGNLKYQELETIVFNTTQQRLYAETLYGLKAFSKEEITAMPASKKKIIFTHFNRVQRFLNRWKQEISNEKLNNFLTKLFYNSTFIKSFCEVNEPSDSIKDKHTFRELGITKKMIVDKLISNNLLPKNFYQLT